MEEPCRSCPEKTKDFGGCRCQAYLLTGNMNATDPVCSLSPQRDKVQQAIDEAQKVSLQDPAKPLIFRNSRNSKILGKAI
jgi:pyrroloquinoline quinone biosynthesis protein E